MLAANKNQICWQCLYRQSPVNSRVAESPDERAALAGVNITPLVTSRINRCRET